MGKTTPFSPVSRRIPAGWIGATAKEDNERSLLAFVRQPTHAGPRVVCLLSLRVAVPQSSAARQVPYRGGRVQSAVVGKAKRLVLGAGPRKPYLGRTEAGGLSWRGDPEAEVSRRERRRSRRQRGISRARGLARLDDGVPRQVTDKDHSRGGCGAQCLGPPTLASAPSGAGTPAPGRWIVKLKKAGSRWARPHRRRMTHGPEQPPWPYPERQAGPRHVLQSAGPIGIGSRPNL